MDSFDRKMIKRLYKLTDSEVFDAEKLSSRLGISPCAAAKLVKNKAVLEPYNMQFNDSEERVCSMNGVL